MAGLTAGAPLHAGLDAFDLTAGRAGGIETYLHGLVAGLGTLPAGGDRYTVLALAPGPAVTVGRGPVALRRLGFGRPGTGWLLRRALRKVGGPDLAAPIVNRLRLDVVHHPFSTVNTPGLRGPSVLTVHDLQHEFFPGNFAPAELERRRRAYPASARGATRVIAISEHVRGTLVERYGLDPARVAVVHLGCGEAFRPEPDPARRAALRARHGLDRPFLYYPAGSWPHKNHGVLLEGLRLLLDRGRFDGDLVLTGVAREAHGALGEAIARLGLDGRVRRLGYLPEAELPALYSAAEALVFPSRFEGFGLPLLEAMACGCPIACADATSLPEVAGPAAVLFDPASPEALADRVAALLDDAALRARLRDEGLRRAAGFTWARTARETAAVYRAAAAEA